MLVALHSGSSPEFEGEGDGAGWEGEGDLEVAQ